MGTRIVLDMRRSGPTAPGNAASPIGTPGVIVHWTTELMCPAITMALSSLPTDREVVERLAAQMVE